MQQKQWISHRTAAAAMGALGMALVVGCGGGGGGGSDTPVAANSTVAGAAIKGAMANAEISLYKTTATGTRGDKLTTVPASIASDASGNYSAVISGYTGVVMVEAKAVAGTTLYDEATGTTITPALGFSLRAVTFATAGQNITVQLNPFTELATVAALAKTGGLTGTNVAQANKDITEALTFDPLTTAAVFDPTSKAPKNALAAALTAISQMAQSGDLGCAGNQAAKVACITSAIAAQGINAAAVQVALQTKLDAVVAANGLTTIAITVPSGTPVIESGITAAKLLIGTLRSNIKALDADDMSLYTELQAVADDFKNHTAPVAGTSIEALDVARQATQFWYDVVQTSNAAFVSARSFSAGSCTLYSDSDYLVTATSKATAHYVACGTLKDRVLPANALGEYKQCAANGELCYSNWSTRVRLHPDALDSNKFTVFTRTRKTDRFAATVPTNGFASSYTDVDTSYGAAAPGNAASLVVGRDSVGQVNALALTGELSPGFTIGGGNVFYSSNLNRWVFVENVATLLGDKENVSLVGTLTNVGGLYTLAVSGSVESIKNGALETRVELLAGSYLKAKEGTSNATAQDGNEELLLKLKASTAGSAATGEFKVSAFAWDADQAQYQPTALAFTGSIQRNGVNFFEGTFTASKPDYATFHTNQARSATNVEKTGANFTGKVTITNRPVLNLQLSATNHDMGSSTDTTLTGQYAQGSVTINIEGTSNAASNILTLTSTNGVKVVVDKSKTLYPLTKGSTAVGQFNSSNSRVDYADGTFEQY